MLPAIPTTLTTTELELFAEVDKVIVRSVAAGDPLIACNYGMELKRAAQLKGVALAKLLHGMEVNWEMYRAAGIDDTFENFIYTYMELMPETTRKYSNMWAGIFVNSNVPDEIKQQLQVQPIEHLLLLKAAIEEGSLEDDDLRQAAILDKNGIRDMVSKARGEQTSSKTAVRRFIQMTDGFYPAGTILAARNGETEIIGALNLDPDTEFGKKALAGILNSKIFIQRG